MKEKVFAITDIHGDYEAMLELLKSWNPEEHQLVIMGDLCDRGPQSKECMMLAKKLVEEYGAIYLRGNHEQMFLNYIYDLANYSADGYIRNGGTETLESFLGEDIRLKMDDIDIGKLLIEKFGPLIEFIGRLPYFYEWGKYLFVHAGVNLGHKKEWNYSTPDDYLWSRSSFIEAKNATGRTIVFGHTPTYLISRGFLHSLSGKKDDSVWMHDNKIGMDGGGIYGGTFHAILFNPNEVEKVYSLKNEDDEIGN
ncbi:MAG: serine/threonine protein phosphatase [Lactobacillales bacterium]|jgi:serine/threonine protein phosphatase 1|nr:serine/threonine protein phosphatase [Lactobacillales bacterium]